MAELHSSNKQKQVEPIFVNCNNELAEEVIRYKVTDRVQYEHARRMRKGYTESEGVLWMYIRDSKLGEKFRRQHPVDSFIVDFICLKKKLIIEIDGSYHNAPDQKSLDEERTKILTTIGFSILRFTNSEVLYNINGVLSKIKDHLSLH